MLGIPTEASKRWTKKDPGQTANEMCMRKPASCDTCVAEAHVRDAGHSARSDRSLRRLCGGNVTVSASVSTTQPNTSRRVSQAVIVLADKIRGSDEPRTPNKRKWSNANDCTARIQRLPSGHHCTLNKNAVVYVIPHEIIPGVAAATGNGSTITRETKT